MGKVAVGTGPCFLSMTFQLWFQCNQCFLFYVFFPPGSHPELPDQQWCHIHSLIVLRLPQPPTTVLLRSLSRCSLEGAAFFSDVAGAAVTLWVPTISCPSSWVTAQLSAQYRKLVHKVSGEPVGHYGLRWVPIVFLVPFIGWPCAFFWSHVSYVWVLHTLVECFDV